MRTVEMFDPKINAWTTATPMLEPRRGQAAASIGDRGILFCGGVPPSAAARCEFYDLETSKSHAVSPSTPIAAGQAIVSISDTRALSIGGIDGVARIQKAVMAFDASTMIFSDVAPMNSPRAGHEAVVLEDGRVVVVGGRPYEEFPSAEIYDPSLDEWSDLPSSTYPFTPKRLHADGQTIIVIGTDRMRSGRAGALVFDQQRQSWTLVRWAAEPRGGFGAVLWSPSKLLIVGEFQGRDAPAASLWDWSNGSWCEIATVRLRRETYELSMLPDRRVFIVGGASRAADAALSDVEIIEPELVDACR
jgi:hypothetical protein